MTIKIFRAQRASSNQWQRLSSIIWSYRWAVLCLTLSNLALLLLSVYAFHKKAIVIGLTPNESLYFVGERKPVPQITESDVLEVSKRFLKDRYQWKSYRVGKITRDLSPISTHSFLKKMLKELEKSKVFIEKNKISQDVIIQKVSLKEGSVVAFLDRVVAVGSKIKAVHPLKVELEVLKEDPNKWNPKGLYVNSLTEFEN